MSAPIVTIAEPTALEPSDISCRNTAALALTVVRDGVITGEGPTTKGRVHFSRVLDADDAAWCARILTATAVEHQPVSRAEAEALFEINDAATDTICLGLTSMKSILSGADKVNSFCVRQEIRSSVNSPFSLRAAFACAITY